MNEEEFLKEHPSSEGLIYKPTGVVYNRNEPIMTISDIHKTQLDKQKVKEVIDEHIKDLEEHQERHTLHDLKKELGLE